MKATINFKFCDEHFNTSTKEITVDTSNVMQTVNEEIDKFLKETGGDIYGNEECNNTTNYEGSVDITVYITVDNIQYSVSEFRDFANNGFKPLDDDYDDYWSCEDDYYGDDDYDDDSDDAYYDYDDNNV